jgi:hypothetical protein
MFTTGISNLPRFEEVYKTDMPFAVCFERLTRLENEYTQQVAAIAEHLQRVMPEVDIDQIAVAAIVQEAPQSN